MSGRVVDAVIILADPAVQYFVMRCCRTRSSVTAFVQFTMLPATSGTHRTFGISTVSDSVYF